jgi:hypothetical protein
MDTRVGCVRNLLGRAALRQLGVDSKLTCPVYGAHDLSGFASCRVFSSSPRIFCPHWPQGRRSGGRVTERSRPSGAQTQP